MAPAEPPSPRHEFIVAAYGESPFLYDCLRSLRLQSARSTIVITTSTPCEHIDRAARAFDVEVRLNGGGGIASDWNFALANASRPFTTLAHQDDVYHPDFAAETLRLFDEHPSGALSFTGYREVDDAGRPQHSRISRVKHTLHKLALGDAALIAPARLRLFLSFGNPLPCSSVTFGAELLRTFRFQSRFKSNLDWEAWIRLSQEGAQFLQTPKALVGRRHNPLTETSRLIRQGVRQAEDREMFRRLWPRPIASTISQLYRASYHG